MQRSQALEIVPAAGWSVVAGAMESTLRREEVAAPRIDTRRAVASRPAPRPLHYASRPPIPVSRERFEGACFACTLAAIGALHLALLALTW